MGTQKPFVKKLVLFFNSRSDGDTLKFDAAPLRLIHPKTGRQTGFHVINGTLHEFNWFKEQYSSWLVGQAVLQDGGLYLGTPVDPLFLALPIIERNSGKAGDGVRMFQDAEQLLLSSECPDMAQLQSTLLLHLPCICDIKELDGLKYYRLNDKKVAAFLRLKLDNTKRALQHCSAAYARMADGDLQSYAETLLGEYLSEGWSQKYFSAHSKICEDVPRPGGVVLSGNHDARPEKRSKACPPAAAATTQKSCIRHICMVDPKELARQKAQAAREEAKALAMAKEAAGMRNIKTFFAKAIPRRSR